MSLATARDRVVRDTMDSTSNIVEWTKIHDTPVARGGNQPSVHDRYCIVWRTFTKPCSRPYCQDDNFIHGSGQRPYSVLSSLHLESVQIQPFIFILLQSDTWWITVVNAYRLISWHRTSPCVCWETTTTQNSSPCDKTLALCAASAVKLRYLQVENYNMTIILLTVYSWQVLYRMMYIDRTMFPSVWRQFHPWQWSVVRGHTHCIWGQC